MASTTESKKDDCCGGRRHGPPTEEERRQREAEFKQELLDEYRKQYDDALISAEQTWELYQGVQERRHAKMKERRRPSHSRSPPPHHGDHSPHHRGPHHFEEKRKEILSELQKNFQTDFATAHGTNKINADQAWLLIQKVQQNKREKWQADRQKHEHGHRHGPPTEEERRQRAAEFKQEFLDEYRKQYGDALISAEQTWELYQGVEERWHAKMKERRRPSHSRSPPPHHGDHSPPHHRGPHHFEEKRKQILSELQQNFQTNFETAHGTSKINADQAWLLIQKVQQNKREKWQADRQKHEHGHRHGPGDHGRRSPPANQ